jgi:hypothetical protein
VQITASSFPQKSPLKLLHREPRQSAAFKAARQRAELSSPNKGTFTARKSALHIYAISV